MSFEDKEASLPKPKRRYVPLKWLTSIPPEPIPRVVYGMNALGNVLFRFSRRAADGKAAELGGRARIGPLGLLLCEAFATEDLERRDIDPQKTLNASAARTEEGGAIP